MPHKPPQDETLWVGIAALILVLGVVIVALLACLSGCSDTDQAKYLYFGRDVQVELWSHGHIIKAWDTSTLILKSPRDVTFIDKETNKVVGVYGMLVITEKGGRKDEIM